MNTLPMPTYPMFNAATIMCAKMVWPQAWDLSNTEAPDSLKKLKREFAERGRITVYEGSSDKTIYGDASVNQAFRAWHDWCHLALDADFSMEGERKAAQLQMKHVVTFYGNGETSSFLCRVLEAEVIGQASYYAKYKEYVDDQKAFVEAWLRDGAAYALASKW